MPLFAGLKPSNDQHMNLPPPRTGRPALAFVGRIVVGLLIVFANSSFGAGLVVGWGDNNVLQSQVPAGLTNVVSVAGGYLHSVALKSDGTVAAWGYNFSGQTNPPAGLTNAMAIAAGHSYSLALRSNGSVISWGDLPQAPPLSNAIAIAAGWNHALALNPDGTVVSWGSQTETPNLTSAIGIAAGDEHNLALLRDGTVVAWGSDNFGKTNVPFGLTNVIAIAAGQDHNLALQRDGTVVAWGSSSDGQASVPAGLSNVVAIAAGRLHSLALKADGTLAAWGNNMHGQATVTPQNGFSAISAGGTHNLAIKDDGEPVILIHPISQSIITTKDVLFQVLAVGNQPLTYQWQRNATNILGETNSMLVLTNVQLSDVGAYRAVVANFLGSATSLAAELTPVATVPFIQAAPESQSIICGDNGAFQVTADGSRPFTYQWQLNGEAIAGAIEPTLLLTNVFTNQVGSYSVIISNQYGAITSVPVTLSIPVEPPFITSPLTANAKQGQPFTYTITGVHSPNSFGAAFLPPGLTLDTTNGIISGIPLEDGTFGPWISTVNACSSEVRTLVMNISSSTPVIISALSAQGVEDEPFIYQIVATDFPTSYAAEGLPNGLTLDPISGSISGRSVYAGEFVSTLFASNAWGVGSASLQFSFSNAPITGLSIANVTYRYSSPYVLDFGFSLRNSDDPAQGKAVFVEPRLLSVLCKEDDEAISGSETAVIVERGSQKLTKTYLVLDFTESIASLSHGDADQDGLSDAVENMVSGAQDFVNQQPADSQIGVYEFHREDLDPQRVLPLTNDKELLNQSIGGIWEDYVQWFPAGSRCWDALVAAINALGATNRDEEHYVMFVSDGRDESSFATVDAVITAATNNGVKVYCIGFGDELDAATLQAITSETQGRYYEATNAADLAVEFAEVGKDLSGQYLLRWTTLKRSATGFMPSFEISYQGFTALSPTNPVITTTNITPPATNPPPPVTNYIIGPYVPAQYTGNVTIGSLRLVANAEIDPRSVTLRASYVPRYIRQLRIHYRANWPCTPILQSSGPGEILAGWSLSETNDGTGGKWLHISSVFPQSLTNSIPFGALGNLIQFNLRDMIDATNAFSLFEVDNTVYTNTGGQRFVLENTNLFTTVYPVLPLGTPVPWLIMHGFTNNFDIAELGDPDADGVPTWKEYQANTNPRDANSKFFVRELSQGPDWRYQIVFTTEHGRTYRVEASSDLSYWEIIKHNIEGIGGNVLVVDERYLPEVTQVFYRVSVN